MNEGQSGGKWRVKACDICCIATGVRMAEVDREKRAQHVEDLKRYIDLAADLGCGLVRTFGGQRDRDREWQYVVDYVVEGYAQVVDWAEERGVVILMETHDDWCSSPPVRAVVEQVGHAHLKVLWDFMHTQRVLERPGESFSIFAEHVAHLHAHDGQYVDGKMQVGALGEGAIDHQTPLQLLTRMEFAGYFSVEVIHKVEPEGTRRVLWRSMQTHSAVCSLRYKTNSGAVRVRLTR